VGAHDIASLDCSSNPLGEEVTSFTWSAVFSASQNQIVLQNLIPIPIVDGEVKSIHFIMNQRDDLVGNVSNARYDNSTVIFPYAK
jgi:hypothetical protein